MIKTGAETELSELIHVVFPAAPLPQEYWRDGIALQGDIPQEFASRILDRPWTKVKMLDWRMTGTHASITRNYLTSDAFRYYLPSLLIGGLEDLDFIDWPLECLLPTGRKRKTTGAWWTAFEGGFTIEQKDAIRNYLTVTREVLSRTSPLAELHLIDEARLIWLA